MAIENQLGHASGDENKHLRGGKPGDQTGREVYTRTWYNRPWNVVIEFKDPKMAEKAAVAMEHACANDHIGYNQDKRNTLLTEARKYGYDPGKVTKNVDTDCSALVALCCMYAGIPESALVVNGNSAYTGNIKSLLNKTGKVIIHTEKKYLTSGDYAKRGMIYLYEGHHVAIILKNGSKVPKQEEQKENPKQETVLSSSTVPFIGRVTANSLNIRKKASILSLSKGTYNKDKVVFITKVNGNWGYANNNGWISLKYVSVKSKVVGKVTAFYLNARKKPIDGDVVKVLKENTPVIINKINDDGTWGYDTVSNAWVSLKYIKF